jgi:hypothetical protein
MADSNMMSKLRTEAFVLMATLSKFLKKLNQDVLIGNNLELNTFVKLVELFLPQKKQICTALKKSYFLLLQRMILLYWLWESIMKVTLLGRKLFQMHPAPQIVWLQLPRFCMKILVLKRV